VKLVQRGRELRNVDEDWPGIVVIVIERRVAWAVTNQNLPGSDPQGVVNVTGEQAAKVADGAREFEVQEMVDACEDKAGLTYLASTAAMALTQTVSEIAPLGHFSLIRGLVDWYEETLVACKVRADAEFND
jgi:hypothetical protein